MIVHRGATPAEWAKAIQADFENAEWQRERAAEAQRVMQTEHSVERFASAWQELIEQQAVSLATV